MDLEELPCSVNGITISPPSTPDRWGLQYHFKLLHLKKDQNEQIEETKMIRRKNIFKIKEQQRKKKNLQMKKQQYLEIYVKEGDSLQNNLNTTYFNELDSTAFSQFESLNSLDFFSSSNNSDNETA
ncbi:hypothetical protein TTHERM_00621140 (macronuclear) [Tetrahymena thermophila SB210]|uniref:Uncharacterized protein n=1 Tax=Tetrahymena thermophila (strain SB210) TaxID=312017 RepID=Q23ME5_TETTS|nr:hypothetical protein TTHERM_00621140 [Tetrahymena thermophila SB210]EAR97694.2 hypothetical protein TTHERM_00621140 [Tetrahymena thermophila SB210]|eukprot:XP_001017939.2 hypothetical protein TTHERM_00621140 [Tetrahymena thermophila SB210]